MTKMWLAVMAVAVEALVLAGLVGVHVWGWLSSALMLP